MPDLDITELRRQIEAASPKHGPGRVVKLERKYAMAILDEIQSMRRQIVGTAGLVAEAQRMETAADKARRARREAAGPIWRG